LTPEAAIEKAERLNQAAMEAGRQTPGRKVITLSVGSAFCPEDGYDIEALLATADRRMYAVKQTHHEEAAATESALAKSASVK
jgi:GGDEF domain-containing protein